MTTYNDTTLAVRTILGEAGNQGYQGQLAVANVINNRVQSGQFGSGVSGVITPSQFNGFDSQTPVGSDAWNSALAAWNAAQAGQDNTHGATYFANPSASTASWAKNLNSSNALQIGQHFFTDNTNGTPFAALGAGVGTDAASALGNAVNSVSAAVSGAASSAANSALGFTGIPQALASIDATVKNLFVRGAVVTIGLVILIAAVWRLVDPDGQKTAALVRGAAAVA